MNYKYGKNFWLLSLSMFFFMTSFNLILPELNSFITELGGADKKGLIITLFTISAAISRPFSGKLTDTIGRKKVIYFGIFSSMLISWIYPFSFSVFFFLILISAEQLCWGSIVFICNAEGRARACAGGF